MKSKRRSKTKASAELKSLKIRCSEDKCKNLATNFKQGKAFCRLHRK